MRITFFSEKAMTPRQLFRPTTKRSGIHYRSLTSCSILNWRHQFGELLATMADLSLKRPHPEDGDTLDSKRARSSNGSPRPTTPASKPDVSAMLAQARAKAEALKARMAGNRLATSTNTVSSTVPAPSAAADKLAQLKARVAAACRIFVALER